MHRPLRVLVVEDSQDDFLLLHRELSHSGYEPQMERVEDAAGLTGALARQTWDAVLADFALPGFSGLEALRLVRETNQDIPFLLVSGAIGEEQAVQALKAGAHDYIMKGHLARLGGALERELREADIRREHARTQATLRLEREHLARQLRFSQAINRMAEAILAEEHEARILCALAAITGETLALERCLIFDVEMPGARARGLTEWLRPQATGVSATLGLYQASLAPQALQCIAEQQAALSSHADLPSSSFSPEEAALYHERMGARSLLWYPFHFRAHGFYLLALNQVSARREFTPEELGFVESVAKHVGLAFQKLSLLSAHRRTEEALRATEGRLTKVLEFWDIDPSGSLPLGRIAAPTPD